MKVGRWRSERLALLDYEKVITDQFTDGLLSSEVYEPNVIVANIVALTSKILFERGAIIASDIGVGKVSLE